MTGYGVHTERKKPMSEKSTNPQLENLPGGRIKAVFRIQHRQLPYGIGALEIDANGGSFRFLGTREEWQVLLDHCSHLAKTTPSLSEGEGIKPPVEC